MFTVTLIFLQALLLSYGCARTEPSEKAPTDSSATSATSAPSAGVQYGLDQLAASKFASLKGKRVGMILNQTSRSASGKFGPDLLIDGGVNVTRLFSPEHGIFGERAAGVTSDEAMVYRGVTVSSLYGSTRKPTTKMLDDVDVLVFDIQDIGVRAYTYVSTMVIAMEAAAENKKEFVVLDRPNPLSGERVEGNILELPLKSFVGQVPVPYLHGMTLGEIAKMAVAKGWFNKSAELKLTVVPMSGWKRSMYWPETGRTWVGPSPNIPHAENAVGAAMLGATGELGMVSIGIGTSMPFLRLGSSLVKTDELKKMAERDLATGAKYVADDFEGTAEGQKKSYNGIRIDLPSDWSKLGNLYNGQFLLLEDLMKQKFYYDMAVTKIPKSLFDKVVGTRNVTEYLSSRKSIAPLIKSWDDDIATFRADRKPYLLYQ